MLVFGGVHAAPEGVGGLPKILLEVVDAEVHHVGRGSFLRMRQ